jgi:hypothetical protein
MLHDVPLTATMTGLFCIIMTGAWLYLGYQIKKSPAATQPPVRHMHNFFLYMAIFTALISVPYLWLSSGVMFSEAMAWGYVVGHIFTYLALMSVSRMVFALVPKLVKYDQLLIWVWVVAIVAITIVNAVTMIWGTQPIYNYDLNLTEFRAAPVVGISIVIVATLSIVPAIVLFVRSAIKSRGAHRVKSAILAFGFVLFMVSGPIHDIARTGTEYAIGDFLAMIAALVIGTGVVFKLDQGLATNRAARPSVAPPSNTV